MDYSASSPLDKLAKAAAARQVAEESSQNPKIVQNSLRSTNPAPSTTTFKPSFVVHRPSKAEIKSIPSPRPSAPSSSASPFQLFLPSGPTSPISNPPTPHRSNPSSPHLLSTPSYLPILHRLSSYSSNSSTASNAESGSGSSLSPSENGHQSQTNKNAHSNEGYTEKKGMTYTIGSLNGRRSKRKETDVQSMIGESGWMEEFDGNEDADEEDEAHFDGTSNGNVSKQNDRNEEEAASLYSNMTRMTLSGIGYKGRPAPPPPAAQPLPPQLPPQPAFTNPISSYKVQQHLAPASSASPPLTSDAANSSTPDLATHYLSLALSSLRSSSNSSQPIPTPTSFLAFKKSSELGSIPGRIMYGLCLRHGWGVGRDEKAGLGVLQGVLGRGARGGEGEMEGGGLERVVESMGREGKMSQEIILAIYEIGISFANGWGTKQDGKKAALYFKIAAEMGDRDAQEQLGHLYANGKHGIKKDQKEAAKWYRMAVEQGLSSIGLS